MQRYYLQKIYKGIMVYFHKFSHLLNAQVKCWESYYVPWRILSFGMPGWLRGWVSAFGLWGWSPVLGYLQGACFSLCFCLCLSLALCLSWINKYILKKDIEFYICVSKYFYVRRAECLHGAQTFLSLVWLVWAPGGLCFIISPWSFHT